MNKLRCEKGQVLVLFTVVLVALMAVSALVVDLGMAYLTKSQLQNMVDASALAGVQELPGNQPKAESIATIYANQNGSADIVQVTSTVSSVTATASRKVNYTFAKVLGFESITPEATATASITLKGISGLRPWALGKGTYNYGDIFTLKEGGGSGTQGWFGIIYFAGQGGNANVYKANIEDGVDTTIYVTDLVFETNGNKNVKQELEENITHTGANVYDYNYTTAQTGDSRVVLIPIIDTSNRVTGFAAVYVNGYDNQGYITAQFLNDTSGSGMGSWGLGTGTGNWGLFTPVLVK